VSQVYVSPKGHLYQLVQKMTDQQILYRDQNVKMLLYQGDTVSLKRT